MSPGRANFLWANGLITAVCGIVILIGVETIPNETVVCVGIILMVFETLIGWIGIGLLSPVEQVSKGIPKAEVELVKKGILYGDKLIVTDYEQMMLFTTYNTSYIERIDHLGAYGNIVLTEYKVKVGG